MFGATNKAPFMFGSANQTPGNAFGNTGAQNTTSFFGQPAQQQQPTSTGFGFGTSTASTGLFGSSGQQQPAAGSTSFFSTPGASTFNQVQPQQSFGSFGTTASAGGLFGQTQQNAGLFGQTQAATGGLFGSGMAPAAGTTVKFSPLTGTDTMMKNNVTTSINTRHQCITLMKEYENKSLEELRIEDYRAGRKGAQGGTMAGVFGAAPNQTVGGGLFGSTAANTQQQAAPNLFGQQNQPKSLFGTTTTNTFGGTTTGLFGSQPAQQQQTGGGLFGAANKTIGFGAPTATTQQNSTFGFGGATNTSGSSFFSNQQNRPLFGQTTTNAPTAGGLFSSAQPNQTTGFGASSSVFGTSAFGATNQQSGGLFGAKTTAFGQPAASVAPFSFGTATNPSTSVGGGGLFGQTKQTGFAAPNSFGSTIAPFSTGGFGATNTQQGLFGATNKTAGFNFGTNTSMAGFGGALGTTTGLFNSTANKGTGLGTNFGAGFGSSFTGFGSGTTGLGMGSAFPNNAGIIAPGSDQSINQMTQQQAQVQQQILALSSIPFGDSSLFRNISLDSSKHEDHLRPTNPAAQKAFSSPQYRVSPRAFAKAKPVALASHSGQKGNLFDGLDDDESLVNEKLFVPRKNIKKLNLKKKNSPVNVDETIHEHTPASSPPGLLTVPLNERRENLEEHRPLVAGEDEYSLNVIPIHLRRPEVHLDNSYADLNIPRKSLDGSGSSSFGGHATSPECSPNNQSSPYKKHPTGIKMNRPGYYTIPRMDEMVKNLDDNGNCYVENFTIGREGYGNVFFAGITNVAGLDLDCIVHFRRKEITVYPDDNNKPVQGQGLNKKAQVTLDSVWPVDKTSHDPITSPERLRRLNYQEKLEKISAKMKAKFLDYRAETGSWVFEVPHFSKYGLEDSDDEEEEQLVVTGVAPKPGVSTTSVAPIPKQIAKDDQLIITVPTVVDPRSPLVHSRLVGRSSRLDEDVEMIGIIEEPMPDELLDDSDLDNSFNVQALTQRVGVSTQRVQAMKASFFADDMDILESSEKSWTASPATRRATSDSRLMDTVSLSEGRKAKVPRQFATVTSLSAQRQRTTSTSTDMTSQYTILPSGLATEAAPTASVLPHREAHIKHPVPLNKSLVSRKQNLVADSGCTLGRMFRVGWGPNSQFAHTFIKTGETNGSMAPFGLMLTGAMKTNHVVDGVPYPVRFNQMQGLPAAKHSDKDMLVFLEEMLQVQLEFSKIDVEDGCPISVPAIGEDAIEAHSQAALRAMAQSNWSKVEAKFVTQCSHVWDLCVALWGKLDENAVDSGNEYLCQLTRRVALSKWLSKVSQRRLLQELEDHQTGKDAHVKSIFSYIASNKIDEATELAQSKKDHKLSLLLAQAGSGSQFRNLLLKQLQTWEESKSDEYISHDRLRLMTILGGCAVWPASKIHVNSCSDLDWKRAFALHLWYLTPSNTSIPDALLEYDKSYEGTSANGRYAQPPRPAYAEDQFNHVTDGCDEVKFKDVCYHLLKLFSDPTYPLDSLLAPSSNTPDYVDYRLSWHLCQCLETLNCVHISTYQRDSIHTSYASQLETIGLWPWAVFVLLHLSNADARRTMIIKILERNVVHGEDSAEKEAFLIEKLLVPSQWVFRAKAIHARSRGCVKDEAWCLLKAGYWNESHRLVISHLAADAIINEEYATLKTFLDELSKPERSATISDWSTGGQVFLTYLRLLETLDKVLKGELSTYDLERLQPEVTALCGSVGNLRCKNARDRLCQAEMAKKTANLMRAILGLQGHTEHHQVATRLLVPHLTNLPLPEDYALQELKNLSRTYLLEATRSDGLISAAT